MNNLFADVEIKNGKISLDNKASQSYLICGRDRDGKRFRIQTNDFRHCMGINLWHGNKYLVREGKRKKIQSVCN